MEVGAAVLVGLGELDITTSPWRTPLFGENGQFAGSSGRWAENVVTVVNPVATIEPAVTRRRLFQFQEPLRNSQYWFLDPRTSKGPELLFVNYDRLATYWKKKPPTFVFGTVDSIEPGSEGQTPRLLIKDMDQRVINAGQATHIRRYYDQP
jgi:hypothetical protein